MRRLENLIASGIVALAVSAAMAPAASLPNETGAPSKTRVEAIAKRVDQLQVRLSSTREIAQKALTQATAATDVTGCIEVGPWQTADPDTGFWVEGDGTESDAVLLASVNPGCTDGGS